MVKTHRFDRHRKQFHQHVRDRDCDLREKTRWSREHESERIVAGGTILKKKRIPFERTNLMHLRTGIGAPHVIVHREPVIEIG